MTWRQLYPHQIELIEYALSLVGEEWKPEADQLVAELQTSEDPDVEKFRDNANVSDQHVAFDGDAIVSRSDDGAYIMAWVWVSNREAGVEHEDPD